MDNVPTRQSNSSIKKCHERGGRRENKMKTSQKLLVDAHLRHSIGKLQDISIEDLSGYDHNQPVSILEPTDQAVAPLREDQPCLMKSLR